MNIQERSDLPQLHSGSWDRLSKYALKTGRTLTDQFDAEKWQEWEEEKRDQFGKRWPEVRSAFYHLQAIGIHLNDVKPGNVSFPDDDLE
jgi:hypothetical protein